ncbi:SDR family oxidoreductase [Pilimelia columellifera]|uniref:NAD(P)H-binding protein n=1 Tax=Pilimelia columellifera subsp. columellifera TaxID=706583 RepID=A0ABN3NG39_9ACTN
MSAIAVTGSSGRLGRMLVPMLTLAGHDVRTMSRRDGAGDHTVDLRTGRGLDEALRGVETVVHLATSNGSADTTMTRTLTAATERSQTSHLVLLSIVGVDRIPLAYYRHKLAAEQIVLNSRTPATVLRATQFHELLDAFFHAQRRLPLRLAPALPVQPIAARDVAQRITALVAQLPAGRQPDLGGPQQITWSEASALWGAAHRPRQRSITIRVPGATARAIRDGHGLVPGPAHGELSYTDHVRAAAEQADGER